ncbi:hypothetical protein JQC91_12595 [Jannaschia sp. Os4]|uniref:hypothetical protein n=1 Tax=Jannaschia sp. Os4 TaxID=2807617 RepID=UPI00193A65F3|nr:hypothetical protein [Jannaschia sp. Os4]MBM2577139.1 hypothetical protein [Jannaschia sp. Os4]
MPMPLGHVSGADRAAFRRDGAVALRGAFDPHWLALLRWDLDVGDCIFFDMATLHGGLAATTPTETVRRFTLRMTGPAGMIRYRGDWAAGERAHFEAADYGEGDRIDGAFFPRLWPR